MKARTVKNFLLALSCPKRTGLIYTVTRWLAEQGCHVIESDTYIDPYSERFFMRVHFGGPVTLGSLWRTFAPLADELEMQWDLSSDDTRPRALIMVSRELHCLLDLLNRTRMDKLRLDIPLIISNHPDAGQLADESGIDFLHLPITPENKEEQEERLIDEIEENNIDFVVLARYMRIIGPEVCERMAGRIINIHHSFLPGFKGARPYQQAHRRGVKLIGATAHYVTADLDEGPIIEQDVEAVTHRMSPAELTAVGHDIERIVLARAVLWHIQRRVLINGRRTVVFR